MGAMLGVTLSEGAGPDCNSDLWKGKAAAKAQAKALGQKSRRTYEKGIAHYAGHGNYSDFG